MGFSMSEPANKSDRRTEEIGLLAHHPDPISHAEHVTIIGGGGLKNSQLPYIIYVTVHCAGTGATPSLPIYGMHASLSS